GPDVSLWFTECQPSRYGFGVCSGGIGRITPLGVVTYFGVMTPGPWNITAGPDGNLWFTEHLSTRIGRITPDGVITQFGTGIFGGAFSRGITAGPDGNLWFTVFPYSTLSSGGPGIGRITPSGVVTEFSTGLSTNAYPMGITAGPDG